MLLYAKKSENVWETYSFIAPLRTGLFWCNSDVSLEKTFYGILFSLLSSLSKQLQISASKVKLKIQNKKVQSESNILASPEAGQGNCLTVALCIAPTTFSCESGG